MKKEITLNGTTVKIEESKEKMTSIHIETEDADIYVNGVLVWQKFDKPEYAKIPPVFRGFVQERNDFIKEEDGKVITDLWMKDFKTCATFYFPKNLRSPIVARLDLVTSLEELESDYIRNNSDIDDETADKLVAEFKTLWNNIEEAVKSAGWKLAYSHDMGDKCWAWWDVIFKLKDWNQESFMVVWKAFSDFNKRLNEVFDQYRF